MNVSSASIDAIRSPTSVLLGIEIGGTKLQLVVGDDHGNIIDRHRFVIDVKRGAASILETMERQIAQLKALHHIVGTGVGYGGPVNWRTGRIVRSYHIAGWDGFELGTWLRERTGTPVLVDNDANVAALAEARCGQAKSFESMVYVTLGSGVGAGFVTGGKIFHGATPGELELGHIRLSEGGLTAQQRCSGWAVDAIVREAVHASPASELAQQWRAMGMADPGAAQGGEAKCLAAALSRQCPQARTILDDTMKALALALSHVVHLLHPHAITIGGGLSLIGDPLIESLRTALPHYLMDAFLPGPHLALASLREDVVPVGALLLASSLRGTNASFTQVNG